MSRYTPSTRRGKIFMVGGAILIGIALSASSCGNDSATTQDQNITNDLLTRLHKNQPLPNPDFSQYLQTLIDVENAEITGVATTTFFYNMGSNVPIKSCPSLGYPVPSTASLTNPWQISGGSNQAGAIGQADPNGLFVGPSSGTYVVCVAKDGTKSPSYWEGDVETEPGPAHYDTATQQIVLDSSNVQSKTVGGG
jgi:hypothetical protein